MTCHNICFDGCERRLAGKSAFTQSFPSHARRMIHPA